MEDDEPFEMASRLSSSDHCLDESATSYNNDTVEVPSTSRTKRKLSSKKNEVLIRLTSYQIGDMLLESDNGISVSNSSFAEDELLDYPTSMPLSSAIKTHSLPG